MRSLVILFNCLLMLNSNISANDNEYNIHNIPFQLLTDADAVIRKNEIQFEIEDYHSANLKVIYAVTIFNKNEQGLGRITLSYNKFYTIEDLEGTIYDAQGKKIRELDDKDVKDYSDFENYTLYSDNRVKFADLYHNKFPYTIEYKYEYEFDGYLSWPSWYSRHNLQPVESTSFMVLTPDDYKLRYWCNKTDIFPRVTQQDNKKVYSWLEKDLPKLSSDVYGEDIEDVATIVHVAPSEFEIDGYNGNMNSWNSFGKWYYELSKGRDTLPEDAITEIDGMISSVPSIKEKIKILYSFLQSKTRYVSIQLGIGGWQPLDAAYVQKNGYGDCKALSNYMIAVLNKAGIKAYPVLIHNGHLRLPLIKDFPSNQFNHVIVCVPTDEDTTWLECTSQVIPFGSIGWSNENREALMVTPEGGVIVKTPSSSSNKNMQVKKIKAKISFAGKTEIKTEIKWLGNQEDYVIYVAEKSSPEEKEKWIKNLLDVPDIKLNNFTFNFDNKIQNGVDLQTDITLSHYGSVAGKRIFFNPNLMERRKSVPKKVDERLSPIRFRYPYFDIDSVFFQIPGEYDVEAVPNEINIQTSFSNFFSKTIVDSSRSILFVRSLEIRDYTIPAENYSEYQEFFAEVAKSDKQQVVLVKKN